MTGGMGGSLEVEQLAVAVAVERFVMDGSTVWIGNFGAQLFAVGDEIVRQHPADLHLVMGSGGLLLDRLVAAGVAAEVTYGHCWSPVGPAPAWAFRRAWEQGSTIRWHELSLGVLGAALTAAAWGVPFLPVQVAEGTGYRMQDWAGGMLDEVDSAFGRTTVVRALPLDVAFVYADAADRWGNAALRTPRGEALAAAQAARSVVVVAEELVERSELDGDIDLPGVLVDAVVTTPGAVHPDGALGRYQRDVEAYEQMVDSAR
jgi:glutaconate CoA-transferase subunit A